MKRPGPGPVRFTDDLSSSRTAHLAFLRGQCAHALVQAVDTTAAAALDGVLSVFTWADVERSDSPGVIPIATSGLDCDVPGHPLLARDRVRYQGQPVAAVDHVVELDLANNRLIPNALEPRAALARYDPAEDRLTVEMTSQTPHRHRRKLAATLGLTEQQIRDVAPAVGGGFGHKGHHHPGEAMAAWCARRLDRPVAWTATRTGNYLAGAHGRDHRTRAGLAVDTDGTIRGLRAETHANVGAYVLGGSASMPGWYGRLLAGQYEIPAIHCVTRSVFTNTAPVHSYRGAGRPEAIYVTERLVDTAARELDFDPVELRRRNLIPADAFPYETPVGAVYDSGDYERALDCALERVLEWAFDAEDLERGQEEGENGREQLRTRRDDGRYRGVGLACYVESTGGGYESGVVRVHPDASVTVSAGTHSHGQGHETTYAQLVADELGVPADDVDVVEGDTDRIPAGTGTFGSRSTLVGGNAVVASARDVLEKARRIAAGRLETAAEDLAYEDGQFHVVGSPDRSVSFGTVADLAHGGVVQGIGQARYEEAVYDGSGNLVTGSLQDYAVPTAGQVPRIETDSTVTPSPTNPLDVKGIGEAGTIVAPPAVVNALVDALSPLGVRHVDMPLVPESVWRAIRDAEG